MSSGVSSLGQLWRSVGFRLAFNYGLLVTITMLATVSIIYLQTVGLMYRGMSRQVQGISQQMALHFEHGGPPALIQEIEQTLSDEQNAATEVFLYLDPRGVKLAGNLDSLPQKHDNFSNEYRRRVVRGGVEVVAYVVLKSMPDGSQLYVGSDLRDQEAVESMVADSITVASSVAVLLLLGGLFVFRQELDRSVEGIRRTLNRVATGELKERVEPSGQEDEFALLANDINRMLDQIEVLMRGVRHVSDTIAHNLRTPLTRVQLRLRSVVDQPGLQDEQRRHIEGALRDIEELTLVFEKLLRIAEAEAGTRRIQFQPVALPQVVGEVLDFYEAVAEGQGAKLVWTGADEGMVLGDADLLAGAIANLVDNALKYGGTGVTVTLGSERSSNAITLQVQDDGPGMKAQDLEKLGMRFFRADRSIAGHGLGVTSVAAVVALHNGQLRFESAQPGLRACITLPLHSAAASNEP